MRESLWFGILVGTVIGCSGQANPEDPDVDASDSKDGGNHLDDRATSDAPVTPIDAGVDSNEERVDSSGPNVDAGDALLDRASPSDALGGFDGVSTDAIDARQDASDADDGRPTMHAWRRVGTTPPFRCSTMPTYSCGTTGVVVAPSNPDVMIVLGQRPESLFRSIDGGKTFTHINAEGIGFPASWPDLLFDPIDEHVLYGWNAGEALLKSPDMGNTWSEIGRVGANIPGSFVGALAIDRSKPQTLYLPLDGCNTAKSIDGGATWTSRTAACPTGGTDAGTSDAPWIAQLEFEPGSARLYAHIILSGPEVFAVSEDDGRTWRTLLRRSAGGGNGFRIAPSDGKILYAAVSGDGPLIDFCASTDAGEHWKCRTAPTTNPVGPWPYAFAGVDGNDPKKVYLLGIDGDTTAPYLFVSTDGLDTWTSANTTALGGSDQRMTLAGDRVLVAASGGLFATRNGGGLFENLAQGMALPHAWWATYSGTSGKSLFSALQNYYTDAPNLSTLLARSTDEGATWSLSTIGNVIVDSPTVNPTTDNGLITEHADIGFGSAADGGQVATTQRTLANAGMDVMPGDAGAPYTPFSISVDRGDSRLRYACGGPDLYVTRDGADHWTKVLSGDCLATALEPRPNGMVFAVLRTAQGVSSVRRSPDFGATWLAASTGLPSLTSRDEYIRLVMVPADPSTVYATSNAPLGYYVSHDRGATFVPTNWAFDSTLTLLADSMDVNILYAYKHDPPGPRILKTKDGGAHWTAIVDGLNDENICSLSVSPTDSLHLFAATCAGGFYATTSGGE